MPYLRFLSIASFQILFWLFQLVTLPRITPACRVDYTSDRYLFYLPVCIRRVSPIFCAETEQNMMSYGWGCVALLSKMVTPPKNLSFSEHFQHFWYDQRTMLP